MPDDLLDSLSFALDGREKQKSTTPDDKNQTHDKKPAAPDADQAGAATATQQRHERRDRSDRRRTVDRRRSDSDNADYKGPERRKGDRRTHAERRLGGIAGRRSQDHKAFQERIENGELTLEEVEFIRAIDRYKRKYERPFPTWSEILAIVKELGYTKDAY